MINIILTILLGWCGYYRFRKKQIGLGFLYVFTFGLFLFGWFNDIFLSIKDYRNDKKSLAGLYAESDPDWDEFNDENFIFRLDCDAGWDEAFCSVFMQENFADMEWCYTEFKQNIELMEIIKNFVYKKLQIGLYLEYYESFYVDFMRFFPRYKFKNKEIENFFITNYADGDISANNNEWYKSRVDYVENLGGPSVSRAKLSEYEMRIEEQVVEFYKFFTYISDMGLVVKSAASKLTLLIIANEFYKEKLKSEYVDFVIKYNIDENLSNEKIIKSFITDNQYFSQSKLAELIAIKNYDSSKSLTTQTLSYLYDVEKTCEIVQKENYLKNLAINNSVTRMTIQKIDIMSGVEFEQFIAELFRSYGYKTTITKAVGDQGVDVLAEKSGIKYAIQAKCYSYPVGNHAIMEAVAGAKYYEADYVIVITNSIFTKSAIELAKKNNVHLWDRKILIEKLNDSIL